jgi:predicted Rossmann fold flavoprotein
MYSLKIAVIGGGAAGFFGAITAAETFPNANITIYEKNRTVLNKVRVSGGGRCNVTHACFDNRLMVKHYPRGERWLRPLLNEFDAAATVRWFDQHGVKLKTEPDGRMFPESNSSETIISCLERTARQLGIVVKTSCGVSRLERQTSAEGPIGAENHTKTGWLLHLLTDETVTADRVLLATGGNPQRTGYEWLPPALDTDGLISPVPSLFTMNVPDSPFLSLAGVAVTDAAVSVAGYPKQTQRGPVLLTHWGFSGPAILRLSAWAARDLAEVNYRFMLRIRWVPTMNDEQVRDALQAFRLGNGKKQVSTQNPFGLPARLWEAFALNAGTAPGQRWADLPSKAQNKLLDTLTNSQFQVSGKTTFKEEFVTCGGIALGSLDPKTLESQQHPGLFFAGEVLDVDGITGGFNFQNAWTTGFVAGKAIGH